VKSDVTFVTLQMFFINQAVSLGARLYMLQDPDLSITSLRRRNSTGVFVGSYLPHLICMDDDILSTGVKLYHLKVYSRSLLRYIHFTYVHIRLTVNFLSICYDSLLTGW